MTNAAIKELIAQGVAGALADYEANMSNDNGNNSHNSRSCSGRTPYTARVYIYKDFLNFQSLNFKCTKGVVELALMYGRMFPGESDEVEKYVGRIPNMIQGNVMFARPKIMQEAIELANDLIDQKAFPLPAIKFPLPEELSTAIEDGSYCQKKRDATARKIALLSMSRRNCQSKMAVTLKPLYCYLFLKSTSYDSEVIEFGDSYEVPANDPSTTTTNTSGEAGTKSRRTVTLTTEDMQKKKNDVKARTTLLLSLPEEHQLRFSQLQFMDVEVEQDDLNQKGNDEVNTASVYTTSSNVPTASENVATVSISQETACAYISSQSSRSQIKFKDINQINEDDMEEMDIKWNMALLSMRADNTASTITTDTTSGGTRKKSGRTVTLTAEDMQKRKNDVKVRTTLLLSLPDEHQLRFSKYKTAKEIWDAILKTFDGNEATKKTKKNLLK
nr:hypothetical protein [Tanacetum cinerariifolium]